MTAYYEMSQEIDRLLDWAIAIANGDIKKSGRTKQKITQLTHYWIEKLDILSIKEAREGVLTDG